MLAVNVEGAILSANAIAALSNVAVSIFLVCQFRQRKSRVKTYPLVRHLLQQARDLLTHQEALHRQSISVVAAMDGIAILNDDGRFLYLHDAHVKILATVTAVNW